jgi:hypothetical protein
MLLQSGLELRDSDWTSESTKGELSLTNRLAFHAPGIMPLRFFGPRPESDIYGSSWQRRRLDHKITRAVFGAGFFVTFRDCLQFF